VKKCGYSRPEASPFAGSPGSYQRADWVEDREIERAETEEAQRNDDDKNKNDKGR
jgi:hypothetical protein